ncbi:unnamed protein product [Porites evermanni]|uniref:C2H2-type domain-containing protein n=2 Tax=Porites TaxID=46719 RepID=A0ABN8NDA4_9CNID|nr:unnamed protein product [Porites lobata]CAH3140135.1 unnamed protein product [Porites evermanni]
MPETTVEARDVLEAVETGGRRKKARFPSQWSSTTTPHQRTLELEGVIEVLREYDSVEGNDINCSICGKLYKSKVCFTKHLWEHSVYWDLFDALKNQERVLSIQAAIILSQPYLEFLLVTSPTSTEKKKDDPKSNQLHRKTTTRKRQRESSTCSVDF